MNLDYRDLLARTLEERCQVNPRYSLRAFARDLRLPASRLSQVMRKKQGLSERSARAVAERLGLAGQEADDFCLRVLASDGRSKSQRRIAELRLAQTSGPSDPVHRLEAELFQVISHWYHYAILELSTTRSFRSDAGWVARRLGITRVEVEAAVRRLRLLDLLEDRDGRWTQTQENLVSPSGHPLDALKRFHTQLLQRALQAVYTQTVHQRDLSSLTLAVDSRELPELVERIRKFRRGFNRHVETAPAHRDPDEVYCLAIQFFRLTTEQEVS
jgi:uncharacterized protein (TIGR02147 family)